MDVGFNFDVCLIPFRSRTQIAKPSKHFVFTMNLHVFTPQKNIFSFFKKFMICSILVLALNFDEFGYRFQLHFGILFGGCFYPFGGGYAFDDLFDGILKMLLGLGSEIRSQHVRRRSSRIWPPSPIFLHTCESYPSKTYKYDFKGFLDFKFLLKVFLHICEYCPRKNLQVCCEQKPTKIP